MDKMLLILGTEKIRMNRHLKKFSRMPTFIFRVRVKVETYNEESRIKATVMDVKSVDYREYS